LYVSAGASVSGQLLKDNPGGILSVLGDNATLVRPADLDKAGGNKEQDEGEEGGGYEELYKRETGLGA
jgi:hypothetical protein